MAGLLVRYLPSKGYTSQPWYHFEMSIVSVEHGSNPSMHQSLQMAGSPNMSASRVGGGSYPSHVSVNAGTEPKTVFARPVPGDRRHPPSTYLLPSLTSENRTYLRA